jgi:hypothetical protein
MLRPGILIDDRLEQMLVDPPQPSHAHTGPKLVPPPHPGHLALATQARKLSPSALLGQHLHQQIHRMHGGKQTQQVQTIKLGCTGGPAAATRAAVGPAFIDEIIRNIGMQQFQQFSGPSGGQFGIHEKSLPF